MRERLVRSLHAARGTRNLRGARNLSILLRGARNLSILLRGARNLSILLVQRLFQQDCLGFEFPDYHS